MRGSLPCTSAAVGSFNIDNVDDAQVKVSTARCVFRTSGWEQRLVRCNRGHATSGNRNVTVGMGAAATPVMGNSNFGAVLSMRRRLATAA